MLHNIRGCIVAVALVCLLGCERSSSQESQLASQKETTNRTTSQSVELMIEGQVVQQSFSPFWIYKDKGSRENHFVPSGFMPNGKCLTFNDAWKEGCQGEDSKMCIKIIYDAECSRQDQKWAGIYWLSPANNWGKQKGGFNLDGAQELSFWAKGEKGGERIEEFKVGGISGDYPDTDMAMIGPVILTNEWREYTIDLRGKDLLYISGGFSWATNVDVNPDGCTFYLDNIRYK
ncbi:MAG: hypothetical protein NUV91_06655 [Candidatus Omnitrophica bacterium]|nr:hypothetical protein [Candidatus Omnitrophota bacterium]